MPNALKTSNGTHTGVWFQVSKERLTDFRISNLPDDGVNEIVIHIHNHHRCRRDLQMTVGEISSKRRPFKRNATEHHQQNVADEQVTPPVAPPGLVQARTARRRFRRGKPKAEIGKDAGELSVASVATPPRQARRKQLSSSVPDSPLSKASVCHNKADAIHDLRAL